MLIAGTAVMQQAAGQLLAVELGKQVLVADVSQELDHLLKSVFNGLVSELLSSTLKSGTPCLDVFLATLILKKCTAVHCTRYLLLFLTLFE